MKNVIYIAFTLVLCFVAFKYGDKHGYEAGYQEGYTFDCKEDIKVLQRVTGALKKSVEYAEQSVSHVKRENDSLKNYEVVKKLNSRVDSLNNLDSVYRPRYDVDGNVSTKELNKAIHRNGHVTDDVLKGIAGIK